MRKILGRVAAATLLVWLIGLTVALSIRWTGVLDGATVSVNGDVLDGPTVVLLIGVGVACGIALVCAIVVAVLASVAIVVPIILLAVVLASSIALVVGLSPVLLPVLLALAAYALLSRRAKRRALSSLPSTRPTS